jgi:hypothetical protein
MKLSVELFRETVDQLRGGSTIRRSERRAAPRIGLRCRIELLPIVSGVIGKPIEVTTRDISRTGIGLLSGQQMNPGDHFLIRVPHEKGKEKPLALYCTVRSCHEISKLMYAIGCSFEDLREKQSTLSQKTPTEETAAPELLLTQIPKLVAAPEPMSAAGDLDRIRRAILD